MDEAQVVQLARTLPEEEAYAVVKQHGFFAATGRMTDWFEGFFARYPEFEYMRSMVERSLKR